MPSISKCIYQLLVFVNYPRIVFDPSKVYFRICPGYASSHYLVKIGVGSQRCFSTFSKPTIFSHNINLPCSLGIKK